MLLCPLGSDVLAGFLSCIWITSRRQMPIGSAGRHVFSRKIMVLMAGAASQTGNALAFRPTPDVHRMSVPVISLAGEVST